VEREGVRFPFPFLLNLFRQLRSCCHSSSALR
jgi:hypothetical protein